LYFEIAVLLGGRTVAELLENISSEEITMWAAYFRVKSEENKKR
jgi:hypothetical protein